MLQFYRYLLVAFSFAPLTSQLMIRPPDLPDDIDLTIRAHRNESGHYLAEWTLKDSSRTLPDNAVLEVWTNTVKVNGRKMLIINGIYTVPPSSPAGYEYFPGVGYYKFYPQGTNKYSQAMQTCADDGAHLAIINSEEEMEVLKSIYARHTDVFRYAYLGYHDQEEEGKFLTIFGEPLKYTGYENWGEGEPNQSYGNEDCGTMHREGFLNDSPCERSFTMPFFCEYVPQMEESDQ